MRLFGRRQTTDGARTPKPASAPKLSPEALSRLEREREEAERDAERRQAGADEIRRACEGPARYWWPGESVPEGRLSGRSWRSRLVERLIGGWR